MEDQILGVPPPPFFISPFLVFLVIWEPVLSVPKVPKVGRQCVRPRRHGLRRLKDERTGKEVGAR